MPIRYENPLRLAEGLPTVDVLAGGRLQVVLAGGRLQVVLAGGRLQVVLAGGRLQVVLSAGSPPHIDIIGDRVFDGDWHAVDFSHDRSLRFAANLDGSWIGEEDTRVSSPNGPQRPRVQP